MTELEAQIKEPRKTQVKHGESIAAIRAQIMTAAALGAFVGGSLVTLVSRWVN